jgi:hypothetical protein
MNTTPTGTKNPVFNPYVTVTPGSRKNNSGVHVNTNTASRPQDLDSGTLSPAPDSSGLPNAKRSKASRCSDQTTDLAPSDYSSDTQRCLSTGMANESNKETDDAVEGDVDGAWDPRGYLFESNADKAGGPELCCKCRNPVDKCHNKMFGKFIQLFLLDVLFEETAEPTLQELEVLFQEQYNVVLRYKIFVATGTLDTSTKQVPECLIECSQEALFQYLRVRNYHYSMHEAITVGRGIPKMGQAKLFMSTTAGTDADRGRWNRNKVVQDGVDGIWDPRGFISEPPVRVAGCPRFCRHCRNPVDACHNKMFGKYLQLQIVNHIHDSDTEPSYDGVKEDFHERYNDVLRYRIFEVTETLDIGTRHVPECLVQFSLEKLFEYIRVREYHYSMHASITVGRGRVPDRKEVEARMFKRKK